MAWKMTERRRSAECVKDEYVGASTDTSDTLPEDAPAGSTAFRADMSKIYVMSPDGTWEEI